MKVDEVPQDVARTYGGSRKLLYAVDDRGRYVGVQSAGWEVETFATVAAVDELHAQRDEALRRARSGLTSPLEFHMYERRMDVATLASAARVWQWRLRRHFRPAVFGALPESVLRRYAEVLDVTVDALRSLPGG